jgi:enterochelin esterase family protein
MRFHIIILALILPLFSHGQSFQDFINGLYNLPVGDRQAVVDSFILTDPLSPIVDGDTMASFFYQGTPNTAVVAGDHNGWNTATHIMIRVFGTDLWYRSDVFETNARIDYKFVLDGTNWILDPENPNTVTGGYGPNSELAMPLYVQPWEIVNYPNTPEGMVFSHVVWSDTLAQSYQVKVYTPPGYTPSSTLKYPVVYFQDGWEYIGLASANYILDNLIDSMLIDPVIGVFVRPNDRNEEYAFSKRWKYVSFFVNELIPWADSTYPTIPDSNHRCLVGASFGANISNLIAANHLDVVSRVGYHSGALWPNNYESASQWDQMTSDDLRIATIWGSYEAAIAQFWYAATDSLTNNGIQLIENEYPEGHSWGLWRATLDEILIHHFPTGSIGVEEISSPALDVYPNPASHFISIGANRNVGLIHIYDMLGQLVFSESLNAETGQIRISHLPHGIYLLVALTDGGPVRQRILIAR